jgi:hypothetical protein
MLHKGLYIFFLSLSSSLIYADSYIKNPLTDYDKNIISPKTPAEKSLERLSSYSKVIYLNGVNITSARNQEMTNVSVKIDESGNIFLVAPQYDVSVKKSYRALIPEEYPSYKKEKSNAPLKIGKNKGAVSKTVSKLESANHETQNADKDTLKKESQVTGK